VRAAEPSTCRTFGKFGTVFRNRTLLLKVQKMSPVRRECFDEVHRNRMFNNIASTREVARETSSDRRRHANKLCIHERCRRDAIDDVRKEGPGAQGDQCQCQHEASDPTAHKAFDDGRQWCHANNHCVVEPQGQALLPIHNIHAALRNRQLVSEVSI
jgi:hypothetical protein